MWSEFSVGFPLPFRSVVAHSVSYWRVTLRRGTVMLIVLINIAIIVVVGAIVFYLIDKYVRDKRLAGLFKILVALVCLGAILQRLLPALGVGMF
jgi:hypothetical protein